MLIRNTKLFLKSQWFFIGKIFQACAYHKIASLLCYVYMCQQSSTFKLLLPLSSLSVILAELLSQGLQR